MWSSRLFWKLFLVAGGLSSVLAVVYFVAISGWVKKIVDDQVAQRLRAIATIAREEVGDKLQKISQSPDETADLLKEAREYAAGISKQTETRVTFVRGDGEVLADSHHDPSEMLNHKNRPELIEAGEKGFGQATRRSPTLGIPFHYVAFSVPRSGRDAFVRVAADVAPIEDSVSAIRLFLGGIALVIGLIIVGLTYAVMGRIIRPLTQLTRSAEAISMGHEEQPVTVASRDEVGTLASAFNEMRQKLADQIGQLQKRNEQLATVLGGMDDGVIAVDAEERILFANETSRELLELTPTTTDYVGRPLLEAVRSQPIQEAVRQAVAARETVQTEFEASRGNRILTMRVTCLPGEPCPGVVIVLHDVSQLRRLESLRQELVANVSHELKTPLAAIKAFAETLRLGAINDTENNIKFVSRIEEQADRLLQLILDMLQIARVERGHEAFDLVDLTIGEIVEACAEQYRSKARLKRITFTIKPPDEPVVVHVDEDGLRAILENLVDNAMKYTSDGGEVAVSWRRADDMALLEVRDTGIGIAEADQARIFERFFRVDKARSRELGGTGLGLSIVKHLSQAFGGSVSIESEVDKGSVFQVRLPIHE